MTFLDTQSEEDVCSKQKIENCKSCQIWLEGYNSPYTKKAYKIHLSLFCKYHNTDPDSLVQLEIEQIKNMVLNYHTPKKSSQAKLWQS